MASAILLLFLLVAVGLYYRHGVRGENEAPRPVGEPVAALKTAPAQTAQPQEADGAQAPSAAAADRGPSFAPPPEVPRPRPAPGALRVETVPAGDLARAAPPAQRSVAPPPPPPPAALVPTSAAPAVAAPRPLSSGGTTAPAPTDAPAPGGARVQIGAFSSAALADKGWRDVAALEPVGVRGRGKHVEAVEKDGHTLYRTSVTGFADRDAAAAFCDALKAKGRICFVKF
jgi:hypothetical protein